MTDEHIQRSLGTIREAIEIATTHMPWSPENFATIMTAIVLDAPSLLAEIERLHKEREDLLAALERLLPLAAQAWEKMDADANEYYSAAHEARAAIAKARGDK